MYYIYHIPGIKIGCSEEPTKRIARQGFTDYTILEEHSCIYEVSKRERELQKEWGYPVDTIPYWKSRQQWGSVAGKKGCKIAKSKAGKKGGRWAVESGHLKRIASAGGKIQGLKNVESGHMDRMRTKESCNKGAKATNAMRVQCPHCDYMSTPAGIGMHKKACKHKPL